MKTLSTILFLLVSIFSFAQDICDYVIEKVYPGDYPPGCWHCGEFGVAGHLKEYTPDTLSINFPCGEIEKSAWFSIHTGKNNFFRFDPTVYCDLGSSVEMAVYNEDLSLVSDCYEIGGFEEFIVPLSRGKRYFVLINEIEGNECVFGFNCFDESCYQPIEELMITPNWGQYCVGSELCFNKPIDSGSNPKNWTIPLGDSLISGGKEGDLEACIQFISPGLKEVIMTNINNCTGEEFTITKEIFIENSYSNFLGKIYSDNSPLCIGATVHFWIQEPIQPLPFYWKIPEAFDVFEGGEESDLFFKANIRSSVEDELIIVPNVNCGLPSVVMLKINEISIDTLNINICEGDCYQIGDSCYSKKGWHNTLLKQENSECDSLIVFSLNCFDIFPSPEIFCDNQSSGVYVQWELMHAADSFRVIVNEEYFITTTNNYILLDDFEFGDLLRIKVQPYGSCTFLPAETSCTFTSTNEFIEENSFKIIPNPSNGKFLIKSELEIDNIEIYDLNGKFIRNQTEPDVSLNDQTGVFLLKIYSAKGVFVERVLIL